MSEIQIDMFEVQLGAALLLQFMTGHGPVRVLADAGIKASGYRPEHVRDRLLPILDASGDRRIDLIIGTHYDEDHLNGLVPIINDTSIAIGEAWIPPIANDSEPHAPDAIPSDIDLLPHQLYSDVNGRRLAVYLLEKRVDCEALLALEGQRESAFRGDWIEAQDDHIGFFRNQLDELIPKDDCYHGIDQEVDPDPAVEAAISQAQQRRLLRDAARFDDRRLLNLNAQLDFAARMRKERPQTAAAQSSSLADIRKGVAKDAINAKALHELTQALRKRNVRLRCEIIKDGSPRRYTWRRREQRFVADPLPSDGPELVLLGPSNTLVRKHWNRLPIEEAVRVAFSFFSEVKSITPSNQLSYIARMGFGGQGILIAGDAGCVDFKPARGEYFPNLLKELRPLHVVQVAHHAGNNAHFYRVLSAAKFSEQRDRSLFLLSHATDDKKRPSPEFREFLVGTLTQGNDVQLLFTSRPTHDKVIDYLEAIHPVVGAPGAVGDVRIVFDGQQWKVKAHAVAP